MTEIIGHWLMNSIRCNIRCTPETLGKACYDGKIFAQLLVMYNVCSSDYLKLMNEAVNKKVALANLKKLCVWFKLLGISINDEFLNEIVNQNGSASLRLLYELFIRLENQESMICMDNKKMQRILSESTNKFQVNPVLDVEAVPQALDEKQYLRDLLNTMKGVMQSAEKKNLKRFVVDGIKRRAELMKNRIMREEFPPYKCFESKPSFPHIDVQAKINEFEELMESPEGKENQSEVYNCNPEEYVTYLKLKRRRTEADKKLKIKLGKSSMEDAWERILKNQEIELKNIISTKLLKQSEHEKQLTLRLKRMRLKYQQFIDTRNMVMNMAQKQESVAEFRSSFVQVKEKERDRIERQRIKELHQRIFKEKMKVKKKLDREACWRIMEDIVDFAMIKHDFFEKNGIKMPANKTTELKLLFLKGVRLLYHDSIRVIKKEEDAVIKLDDVRLEELSEYDFYLYMYLIGPWSILQGKYEDEQLNITGFIVHRLLDLKYNFNLSAGEPADLPSYSYKIFLQRINDTFALEKLKHYLSKFRIEVLDIFQVINYFLNSYKSYAGIEIVKETNKTTPPLKNKSNSVVIAKGDRPKFKPWSGLSEKSAKEKAVAEKAVQFPSTERLLKEKTLSSELGRYVYDYMITGTIIPDSFVCYLIIEYLKTLKDIDGWVLINYPENITQIAILEFMFTGLEVPYMPRISQNIRKLIAHQLKNAMPKSEVEANLSFESPSEVEDKSSDYESIHLEQYSVEELIELKNSNILPRPYPPPQPLKFESFFTKVILLQREAEKKTTRKSSRGDHRLSMDGEESLEEKLTLEIFYATQDISSIFHYKYFDTTTLKKLLTIVLNISASKQNEFFKTLDKGFDVISKPAVSENNVTSPKPLKNPFKRNGLDEWILKAFQENEEGIFEEMHEEEAMEDEMLIFPGNKDWEYTRLIISEFYVNILATVWESIEYFFTSNMKRCFLLQRTVEKRLMPYRNYVRKKAEECLSLDDDRAEAVTNFQMMLNKINDHHRSLDSMKNELHNRILKLQCELWKMTDVKKFYCEQVLELILGQNWLATHLTNLLQVYCLMLQVEADRFADTMQLIEDYYCVSVLGKPQDDRLMKISLPRVGLKPGKKEELARKTSKHSFHSTPTKKGRSAEEKHLKNAMDLDGSRISLYYSDFETSENPALSLLKTLISRLSKNVAQVKTFCEGRSNSITDKLKEHSRQNVRGDSVVSKDKQKGPKEITSGLKRILKDPNMTSEMYNSIINKISLEWVFAIDNEAKRALYRITLIEKRGGADISEDINIIGNTFREFEKDIVNLYHNQIINIDKVCDLMRAAVEEEVKIQPLVVLRNDTLEIDNAIILYPDAPPPPPSSLVEVSIGFKFTVSQLTNLFYKFVYVAPYGIIEQAFVLILEDMASIGHETGHSYLPHYWSDLSPAKIKDIINRLYGDKIILDWRLFIIAGLDLGFPTMENILDMRYNFRILDTNATETATYEQYNCVFLWFEGNETTSITQDLYIAKAKELIFKLFQIDENLMNYTDFLLAFCRDTDPREGFVKALALAEGCATICWKQDLFRETFQIEKENEKYNIAYGILTIVVAGVYQIVDSVIITEVPNEDKDLAKISTSNSVMVPSSTSLNKKGSKPNMKRKKKSPPTSYDNNLHDSSYEKPEQIEEEEVLLEVVEKEKPRILWKSDVYFSTVFSLLMLEIHHFALSSDQIYEPFLMEENLRRIFQEKGDGHTMKLHVLITEVYIQKLFSSYKCFQAFSLPQLLTKIARDDCSSIAEQE